MRERLRVIQHRPHGTSAAGVFGDDAGRWLNLNEPGVDTPTAEDDNADTDETALDDTPGRRRTRMTLTVLADCVSFIEYAAATA